MAAKIGENDDPGELPEKHPLLKLFFEKFKELKGGPALTISKGLTAVGLAAKLVATYAPGATIISHSGLVALSIALPFSAVILIAAVTGLSVWAVWKDVRKGRLDLEQQQIGVESARLDLEMKRFAFEQLKAKAAASNNEPSDPGPTPPLPPITPVVCRASRKKSVAVVSNAAGAADAPKKRRTKRVPIHQTV